MTQIRNVFFLLLLTQYSAVGQTTDTANAKRKFELSSGNFFGLTNDVIYWEGVEYMCSESPLSEFEAFKKLTFKEGRLDSEESEKLLLEDNQYIYQGYFSNCNDKILWHDTTFFIDESPLSFFKNYKEIYPNEPVVFVTYAIPISDEKNYVPKWVIVNDMLYLYNISFISGNHEFNNEYLIRFQPIEKLTGKKFQQTPYVNVKVIFADWFSGVMYLKRYPEKIEEYWESDYNCEPFYKLLLENGKIVSKEKTNYMILKRNTDR